MKFKLFDGILDSKNFFDGNVVMFFRFRKMTRSMTTIMDNIIMTFLSNRAHQNSSLVSVCTILWPVDGIWRGIGCLQRVFKAWIALIWTGLQEGAFFFNSLES
jgi:hypothetical protein